MLILSRKKDEKIIIGDDIRVSRQAVRRELYRLRRLMGRPAYNGPAVRRRWL